MSPEEHESNDALESLIAKYLEAEKSGQNLDRDALIEGHPELADSLRDFFANHDRMKAAANLDEPTLHPTGSGFDEPTIIPGPRSQDDLTIPPQPFGDDPTIPPTEPRTASGAAVGDHIRYFGDYELLEEIARGGMGVVFKARQVNLNRIVALKMILAGQFAGREDVQRFYTEAEAAANLDHPGIVPIFEIGEHEGQHYFSMGYIEGDSLAHKVADGPLPPREAAELVKKICDAMAYAHERGVIHRDLKPANILIDAHGQPKVTDFGLAKKTEADGNLTGTGQILGTPAYMPPEQASGKTEEVGPLADVYALGAILYCLLTGRPPFQAATPMDTLLQLLSDDPIPVRRINSAVPRDLETITGKCLQKNSRNRYSGADRLADDLERYLSNRPIEARPVSSAEVLLRWAQRNRAVAILTAILLLAVTVGFATSVAFGVLASRRADRIGEVLKESENRRQQAEVFSELASARDREARLELSKSLYEQAAGLRLLRPNNHRERCLAYLAQSAAIRKELLERAEFLTSFDSGRLPTEAQLRTQVASVMCDSSLKLVKTIPEKIAMRDHGHLRGPIIPLSGEGPFLNFDVNTGETTALPWSRGVYGSTAVAPTPTTLITSPDKKIRHNDVDGSQFELEWPKDPKPLEGLVGFEDVPRSDAGSSTDPIVWMQTSADSKYLVAKKGFGSGSQLAVWETSGKPPQLMFTCTFGFVAEPVFDNKEGAIYLVDPNSQLIAIDLASRVPRVLGTLPWDLKTTRTVCFDVNDNAICVAGFDPDAVLMTLDRELKIINRTPLTGVVPTYIAQSPNGKWTAVISRDSESNTIYSNPDRSQSLTISLDDAWPRYACWSNDSKYLATFSTTGTNLWQVEESLVATGVRSGNGAQWIHPDGLRYLRVRRGDESNRMGLFVELGEFGTTTTLRVWRPEELSNIPTLVQFSDDGNRAVVGGGGGYVILDLDSSNYEIIGSPAARNVVKSQTRFTELYMEESAKLRQEIEGADKSTADKLNRQFAGRIKLLRDQQQVETSYWVPTSIAFKDGNVRRMLTGEVDGRERYAAFRDADGTLIGRIPEDIGKIIGCDDNCAVVFTRKDLTSTLPNHYVARDPAIFAWDVDNREICWMLTLGSDKYHAASVHPEGTHIAILRTRQKDLYLSVFDLNSVEPIWERQVSNVKGLAWDSKNGFVIRQASRLEFYQLGEQEPFFVLPISENARLEESQFGLSEMGLQMTPDGRYLSLPISFNSENVVYRRIDINSIREKFAELSLSREITERGGNERRNPFDGRNESQVDYQLPGQSEPLDAPSVKARRNPFDDMKESQVDDQLPGKRGPLDAPPFKARRNPFDGMNESQVDDQPPGKGEPVVAPTDKARRNPFDDA